MFSRTICIGILLLGWMHAAIAADAKDLTSVFDAYNAAIKSAAADQLEPALALRTTGYRESGADQRERYPEARKNTLEEMRFFVPLNYSVESAALGEEFAALALMAKLKIDMQGHPKHGQTIQQTIWVDFALEDGAWKIGGVMLAPDSAQIKRSPDTKNESEASYDLTNETSLGGRIVRVDFETDHTLVVLLTLDEEQLAYLPDKATLEAEGFSTDKLMSPRLLEVDGHPHRTNKFKTLATGATLR